MNDREIISLTAGIFHIALTFFVLSRDRRSPVNRVYFLWGMSLIVFNLSSFVKNLAFDCNDKTVGEAAVRVLHFAVVFLPITSFHLYLSIAQVARRRMVVALYIVHILFAISVFTHWYMAGVTRIAGTYYADGRLLLRLFMVLLSLMAMATISLLYLHQRKLPEFHRTRLRALLLGFIILYVAGLNDSLPTVGMECYPGTAYPIRQVANLASLFFGIIVSYAVLQHHLLDIRLALSQKAAQLVRLAYLLLSSFLMLQVCWWMAPGKLTPYAYYSSLGVSLGTAFLASFLFPRFLGHGEDRLERWILGDQFEYQGQIHGFIQRIPLYTETETLLQDLNELLVKTIGISQYQIILLDETNRSFALFHSHPPRPATEIPELTPDSPLFHFFLNAKLDYLTSVTSHWLGETTAERVARRQLKQCGWEICFPLVFGKAPFGLFLLGGKLHREPYTSYDLRVLGQMVQGLRSHLNQIRLTHQLLQVEEMELLGRMSRGMAHDLNNLLTTVWTYLQLAQEKPPADAGQAELLPNVMRNVETIRAYVREALFLSQHHTPRFQSHRVDALIRKSVEIIESRLQRKKLTVEFVFQTDMQAEIDEVLIQRLIGNLLGNAIDASPMSAVIRIELMGLPQLEGGDDGLRLRIIDRGCGMSPENLKKVATAYFTTKDRGDESRGFGLGLAICRKIVHMHRGSFTIASEPDKGTTVQIDLPARQPCEPVSAVKVQP
jgi:signal transduction histidine kinase